MIRIIQAVLGVRHSMSECHPHPDHAVGLYCQNIEIARNKLPNEVSGPAFQLWKSVG